jgi:hypothetical protein
MMAVVPAAWGDRQPALVLAHPELGRKAEQRPALIDAPRGNRMSTGRKSLLATLHGSGWGALQALGLEQGPTPALPENGEGEGLHLQGTI